MPKFNRGDRVIYRPDREWRGKVVDTRERLVTVFWRKTKVHDDFTIKEANKYLRIIK